MASDSRAPDSRAADPTVTDGPAAAAETASGAAPGRIQAIRAHAAAARVRADIMRRELEGKRDQNRGVNIAFTAYEHDRDSGGSLLAGAIAYRMFLWTLPVALVVVGGLGFLSTENPADPGKVVRDVGITSIPAQSIDQAAKSSTRAWWVVVILGVVLMYFASVALVKALWVAHALVWRITGTRIRSKPRLVGIFLLACVAIVAATSVAAVIRNASGANGLIAMIADVVVYAGAWFGLSTQFPHRDASWPYLIPGAIVFGLGVQVLHLVSVYYLSGRLSRSSLLYGTLGAAAALLLGMYFVGRLMILSAQLNEAIWVGRSGPPRYDNPTRASTSSTGPTAPAKNGPNSANRADASSNLIE
jgi:uncharacterized BrkB/YihY/UPF0761 family membrane protein